ncbi:MAG: preprotein translocase subunit SecA [Candidatus Nomurabacteria bacterium]|nr:MAG: preprotein translocase subunit SecA [Candidatus Nomurabacteria bacterium]HRV75879.1 preprotein translocase subunit SecA [Candidatus Saccharimonadales bacterium]
MSYKSKKADKSPVKKTVKSVKTSKKSKTDLEMRKGSKINAPVKNTVRKALGDPQEQALRRMRKVVSKINKLEENYIKLTDKKLKEESLKLKERAKKENLDELLPEAFAIAREAAKRALGQRHFDVQLIGAMVLHEGGVAEMKTGEGKTLMSVLAVYLNALSGKGVHVVTVNDYLAQRDAGWNAKIYDILGMSVGVIIPDESFVYDAKFENKEHIDERFWNLKPATRKEAYNADITYGTNNEFGFDYLRDNMVDDINNLRQRDLNFAIVDEVDSILIDEARTPLIISASAAESSAGYRTFAEIATHFESEDYVLEEKRHAVNLTDSGIDKVEKLLGIENLYDPKNIQHIYHLEQALKAQTLFKRDKDYVVSKDGEVIIVDSFTGRLLPGRRYNEGLHQAIEAKEGVRVQEESVTLATISFQNYFRLYEKLGGMTGTAKTEEEEFNQVYDMSVIEVPPNRTLIRKDLNDRIYATERAKLKAIAQKVKELNKKGQPVLIGSVSIEKNEMISQMLSSEGVKHNVLNAKNNESEALIIAKAGQKGAVTLATNIAGRGTDILLSDEVKELGGLFVLGSERHESRRIDNQLRGRAGRQGDPGTTQFYISAEDELMRVFGGETLAGLMVRLGGDTEDPIERKSISKAIERSQKLVEGMSYDSRKSVVQYDDVMNRHRRAVYSNRKAMLKAEDHPRIKALINEAAEGGARDASNQLVNLVISKDKRSSFEYLEVVDEQFKLRPKSLQKIKELLSLEEANLNVDEHDDNDYKKGLKNRAKALNPVRIPNKVFNKLKSKRQNTALSKKRKSVSKEIRKILLESFNEAVDKFAKDLDDEIVFGYQRLVYLQILDELWMQHLENMGHLREGIGWRSVGQKDPLVEYRFEGQRIFEEMMRNLRMELSHALVSVNPKMAANQKLETELTKAAGHAIDNADEISSSQKEFEADDFKGTVKVIEMAGSPSAEDKDSISINRPKASQQQKKSKTKSSQQKARKKQRQNKKKARR